MKCALSAVFTQRRTVDQATDTHLHWEFQLIIQLGNQEVVAESLPRLHYSDDSGVDLVLPVLEYSLGGAHLFFNLDGEMMGV